MTERQNDQSPIVPNIGQYNDAIADIYDKATAAQGWSINELVAERLRAYSKGNYMALDLGAGTGQTVGVVLEEVDVLHITAVDASSKMLGHLRRKYPSPIVKTVEASIEDYVRSSKDTFDLITAIGSLEFVKDLPATLGELALRLRPGGLLLATYIQREGEGVAERTFQAPSLGQAFTEYYWDESAVYDSLVSQHLKVEEDLAIPAYQRGDERVEYRFMSVTNPQATK